MNISKQVMIVPLNRSQLESLKFYTGVTADKYIATREEALEHLNAFMSAKELDLLQCNNCFYLVIFELETINNNVIQTLK